MLHGTNQSMNVQIVKTATCITCTRAYEIHHLCDDASSPMNWWHQLWYLVKWSHCKYCMYCTYVYAHTNWLAGPNAYQTSPITHCSDSPLGNSEWWLALTVHPNLHYSISQDIKSSNTATVKCEMYVYWWLYCEDGPRYTYCTWTTGVIKRNGIFTHYPGWGASRWGTMGSKTNPSLLYLHLSP